MVVGDAHGGHEKDQSDRYNNTQTCLHITALVIERCAVKKVSRIML